MAIDYSRSQNQPPLQLHVERFLQLKAKTCCPALYHRQLDAAPLRARIIINRLWSHACNYGMFRRAKPLPPSSQTQKQHAKSLNLRSTFAIKRQVRSATLSTQMSLTVVS